MFEKVVALYRGIGRPDIEDGRFSYCGEGSADISALLSDLESLPSRYGVVELARSSIQKVDFEFSLPATEHGRFHASPHDFVLDTPSLEFGLPPQEFYIVDIDFYSRDSAVPNIISGIINCCEFIRLLTCLAVDTPMSRDEQKINRLIFVLAADGKSPPRTFSMRTKLTPAMISLEIPHLSFLRALLSPGREERVHIEERKIILQSAIAEVLAESKDRESLFQFLVEKWRDVLQKYRHNFQAFIHQYSFEKVRKDIGSAEIEHATKLSGVLGDISGKLLALPVSIGGVLLLIKTQTAEEFFVLLVGLVVVSVIFLFILYNQWLQVDRIRNSFAIVFGQYYDRLDTFPKNLREPIEKARDKVEKQNRVLSITFHVFGVIAALPLLGALYGIYRRYEVNISSLLSIAKGWIIAYLQ